jgi:predicted DNA-binding transcriptional regulator YafY
MTVESMAISMNCKARTIYRHIQQLEKENCGLHKFKQEGQTFYVIQPEQKTDFNQDLVKKLEKLRKSFESDSPTGVKNLKIIDNLINSLSVTDPDSFKVDPISVDPDFELDYGPFCDHNLKKKDAIVSKILKAIHDGVKITITYRSATHEEEQTTVTVSPVKLVLRIDTLYLIAADDEFEETQIFKNFMVENIVNMTTTTEPIVKFAFDLKTHYKYTFGKWTNANLQPQDISLLVKSKWLQTQFKKSNFVPAAVIKESKSRFVVDLKLRITPDFKSWLLGVLPDVEILKPASLKADMKNLVKEAMKSLQG